MHRVFLLSFFLLLTGSVLSQSAKKIDSLLTVLESYPRQDTVRLNLLLNLSRLYYFVKPDSGILRANEAIALAEKEKSSYHLATAYRFKGMNNKGLRNFDQSKQDYEKSIALFKEIGLKKEMAETINDKGNLYETISDYSSAINHYLQALKMHEESGYEMGVATGYGNLGVISKTMGDYAQAISYYNKAGEIFRKLEHHINVGYVLQNIAIIYNEGDSPDYDTALKYANDALKIFIERQERRMTANCYNVIADSYRRKGNYLKEQEFAKVSLTYSIPIKERFNTALSYFHLSSAYLLSPDSILRKFDPQNNNPLAEAKRYQLLSLQILDSIKAERYKLLPLQNMIRIYEKERDYENALIALKKYTVLDDSLFNDKRKKEILGNQFRYELEKRDALRIAELRKQKEIKNFIIAGAGLILVSSVLIFISYKRRRDAKLRQREADLKAEMTATEMKALRAQMNPHFIFNSLNSISDYIARNNTELADEYLTKFAKLMRLVLENSEKKEVPLADDLQALELYIQLEAHRMKNKFNYEIKVDESIDRENTLIPPLILQPFVENSIWHGIAKKQGSGKIIISIKKENDMISCVVEDDGIGRKQAATAETLQHEKRSMGMKITKERVAVLNKRKNTNAGVYITDLATGTRVELKLPLEISF